MSERVRVMREKTQYKDRDSELRGLSFLTGCSGRPYWLRGGNGEEAGDSPVSGEF